MTSAFQINLMLRFDGPHRNGNSLIHIAILKNDKELFLSSLQNNDADVNHRNGKGETPLALCAKLNSDEYYFDELLKAGCDINNCNLEGRTALHEAVVFCESSIVHKLIKWGADINAQDDRKFTPLHYAVLGHTDTLEITCMLLYYNADITLKCQYENTPFLLAITHNKHLIAETIFNYYDDFSDDVTFDGNNALNLAIYRRSSLALKLVEAGIDVNTLNSNGNTNLIGSLDYKNSNLFKSIWFKFDYSQLLLEREPFLLIFVDNLTFSKEEWIECLYLILECPLIHELIEHARKNITYEIFEYGLFSCLLKTLYCHNISLKDRLGIICAFLSVGYEVNIRDINFATILFGFKEEIEMFIYAGNYFETEIDLDHHFSLFPQPAFMFSTKNDPYLDMVIELFKKQVESICYPFEIKVTVKNIIQAVRFFAIPLDKRQILINHCQLHIDNCQFDMNSFKDIPEIPSLIELSRREARKFIQVKYRVKKAYQFYDIVKGMNYPQKLKDVLGFKTPIY